MQWNQSDLTTNRIDAALLININQNTIANDSPAKVSWQVTGRTFDFKLSLLLRSAE